MKIIRKIILLIMVLMMILSINFVNASFKIDHGDLYSKGRCESLLIDTSINAPIIVTKVFYNDGSGEYPAYCLNRELLGVGEAGEYSVSVDEQLINPLIWRVITNGYPYKSLAELGVASEDEAYTATKQAVYCVLYNNDANDFEKYNPIGEAGERTLNAMKNIVYTARNSDNSMVSSNLEVIEKSDLWSVDDKDSAYISKEFSVSANAGMSSYSVKISGELIGGTKVTDIDNNDKESFSSGESFKILIPIRGLEKSGSLNIEVNGDVATKPVLYGNSNDPGLQDYALTGSVYELGNGNIVVNYNKNTTKLIIKKIETGTEKSLTGAIFRILDSDSNIVYDNLVVNEEGIVTIEGMLPGDYFLEEIKAPEEHEKFDGKLDFKVDLNEEVTLNINNTKTEKIEKEVKVTSVNTIQKLPKTGM